MEKKYYSSERNVQLLISLLKQHNIQTVIASPGTTNMTFVASIMQDKWFKIYSCVDERSAAYMACGLASESKKPVVITCTGATASRNYFPAITEAYYRKLPVLAITGARDVDTYGHLNPQTIDRRNFPNDTYNCSVYLQYINNNDDEWANTIKINKAILALTHRGGGPSHINLVTKTSGDYTVKVLPKAHAIFRITLESKNFPQIQKGKIAIFIGNHSEFTPSLSQLIDSFCDKYNAVAFCDNTSGYHGKYRVQLPILSSQEQSKCTLNHVELLIHIGEISGAYMKIFPKTVWRVSSDGELRDHFRKLSYIFEMSEEMFFNYYLQQSSSMEFEYSFIEECKRAIGDIRLKISPEKIPFSNIWIASQICEYIPTGAIVHFSILNSLRSWNYFELPADVRSQCNTGGFGIDGPISTLIGASFNDSKTLSFLIVGDLAFFYDLNSLGNHYIKPNVRILLINNGEGIEFKNYLHPAYLFGDDANEFIAAKGHFGNKSKKAVKDFCQSLGFEYHSADSKDDFLQFKDWFLNPNLTDKPLLFEVFTDEKDEDLSIQMMNNLNVSSIGFIKKMAKTILPQKTQRFIVNRIINK